MLTEMCKSRQYLAIDTPKIYYGHSYAHKPPNTGGAHNFHARKKC